MRALLGDIGATNARFALLENGELVDPRVLACADYPTLQAAIETYLASRRAEAAALAIAAPVTGRHIAFTNLPWAFETDELARQFGFAPCLVLNDFAAAALAIPRLAPADLRQVGGTVPAPDDAPRAILGPGSGLGVASLMPLPGGHFLPLPGEGGHATLAAVDAREAAVIAELARRFGHVSVERVLSGPGLVNLYAALSAIEHERAHDAESLTLAPAEISERARNGDVRAEEAVRLFCDWLGSVAGNLALTMGARGGVYVGGGVVGQLGSLFDEARFRARFEAKGRMKTYLAPIPIFLVSNRLSAFLGLAQALAQANP
ncbi:MAG: glucokinase [Rhodospirillales bacterium]|nr:glucokinase [Rhodospirillales bacterium]